MKISLLVIIIGLCAPLVGCGPSKAERDAEMRARLEQQERDDRAVQAANQAITEMNKKMFRKLTPEEQAQRDEERKRNAQKLVDEMKAQQTQP